MILLNQYWKNYLKQLSLNSLYTINQIAKNINGDIEGDPDFMINGVCDLINGETNKIAYVLSEKYAPYINKTKASAILINNSLVINEKGKNLIRVENPGLSFIEIINMFKRNKKNKIGIHEKAVIDNEVKLGKEVYIGPYAVIEKGAIIHDKVSIGAGSFVGENTKIGYKTNIKANVTIYHDVIIKDNCIIESGSIIGADGFGLVSDNGIHHKMPHVGNVIINNNVWIGANCCIDRGTLNDTIIDEGTKFDNFIQIAHNVKIGKNCRISGQTAIAGSSILEDNITIGGQVGIIDHLHIGANTVIAAKSAVFESIKPNSFISGIPAKPHKNRLRQEVIINQLPEILNRLRKIEKNENN